MTSQTSVQCTRWSASGLTPAHREVAQETPVAIVHDGSTTAVMLASPDNLEDFALGFTLTEGIARTPEDVTGIEVVQADGGIEARVWLAHAASAKLTARRRLMAGPTGCGLCGVESLAEAQRSLPAVNAQLTCTPQDLQRAMLAMMAHQTLGRATRAAHAAGFWSEGRLVAVREDVGRHNALDKLVGALAQRSQSPAGVILLTSRVSVEMIQKAAIFGAPIVCAVSAPTAMAIRTAEGVGMTLVGVCRPDGFEIFSRPDRIG